jgi:hypothetical protein
MRKEGTGITRQSDRADDYPLNLGHELNAVPLLKDLEVRFGSGPVLFPVFIKKQFSRTRAASPNSTGRTPTVSLWIPHPFPVQDTLSGEEWPASSQVPSYCPRSGAGSSSVVSPCSSIRKGPDSRGRSGSDRHSLIGSSKDGLTGSPGGWLQPTTIPACRVSRSEPNVQIHTLVWVGRIALVDVS